MGVFGKFRVLKKLKKVENRVFWVKSPENPEKNGNFQHKWKIHGFGDLDYLGIGQVSSRNGPKRGQKGVKKGSKTTKNGDFWVTRNQNGFVPKKT